MAEVMKGQNTFPLLVLDLDETLVHANRMALRPGYVAKVGAYYLYLRPGLSAFLHELSAFYQLAIWSSASADYVTALLPHFWPQDLSLTFCWTREHCSPKYDPHMDTTVYEKRLKKLKNKGFTLEQTLIVDNTPEKVRQNYGNAIYIPSYEAQVKDDWLSRLANYLKEVHQETDYRKVEKRLWQKQF